MAKDLLLTENPNNDVNEAYVPLLLRISVWISRAMCVSPARLRRAGGRWRLALSRPLAKLQRLLVVIVNILTITAYTCDFLSEKRNRLHVGKTILSAATSSIEVCLLTLVYSLGVLNGPKRLTETISILQQINQIETTIKKRDITLECSKVKHVLLIVYIVWQILIYVIFSALLLFLYHEGNRKEEKISTRNWFRLKQKEYLIATCYKPAVNLTFHLVLVASLYTMAGYQATACIFLQLEWSMTLVEIWSTLKLINDELEWLLKNTTIIPQFINVNTDIRCLSLSYDAICEMLRQIDFNGPFILIYFIQTSLHFLLTPYNVIVELRVQGTGIQSFWGIAVQIHWMVLHFSRLILMVEPSHWFQEEKERTGHLLTGLACQASRRRLDPALLASFLQQTQTSSFPLRPCGVFTLNRPFVASVIGGIGTYLIIILQFQYASEMI